MVTHVNVSPQLCGAAELDCAHDFFLLRGEGIGALILVAVETEDIRDFQRWPVLCPALAGRAGLLHDGLAGMGVRRNMDRIQGAAHAPQEAVRHTGISDGGSDGGMAQEGLNHSQVIAVLQKMGGKAVAHGVHGDFF